MATRIQIRRDTAANWTSENPTLSVGEFGYETDTSKLKIGDGSTAWTSLSYFVDPNSTLSLNDITDLNASSATTGQVLTAQSDGTFSFADSGGGTVYQNTYVYEASSGQTTFSGADDNNYELSFTSGQTMVFLNGVLLVETTDYSEGTNAITLTQAAEAEDLLLISTWETSEPEVVPYSFQGSNYGYTCGGIQDSGQAYLDIISKFPFAADENATDVGDLTVGKSDAAGQTGYSYGYTTGGYLGAPTYSYSNVIEKFPFSSGGNATDVGDLTITVNASAGQSSSTYGYTSGGGSPEFSPNRVINIEKFPFASDGNGTDVGDLTQARTLVVGQSSTDYGYTSSGYPPSTPYSNIIDKFPFASNSSATDVGNLTVARYSPAGQSSTDYGYSSGGYIGPPNANVIDKFPFSSDGNATDVGDLTVARESPVGQSSTDYGYSSGGSPGPSNVIDKFPFSSDANAADVGDLTVVSYNSAGQQR